MAFSTMVEAGAMVDASMCLFCMREHARNNLDHVWKCMHQLTSHMHQLTIWIMRGNACINLPLTCINSLLTCKKQYVPCVEMGMHSFIAGGTSHTIGRLSNTNHTCSPIGGLHMQRPNHVQICRMKCDVCRYIAHKRTFTRAHRHVKGISR